MQNHTQLIQQGHSEPIPSGNPYPRRYHPSSNGSRTLPRPRVLNKARDLDRPESATQSTPRPSERIFLKDGWYFSLGNPIDAPSLTESSRGLRPMVRDILSSLEDDAVPTTRRGAAAEENLADHISCMKPDFADSDWVMVSLSDVSEANRVEIATGWYRRTFESPATDANRRMTLEMEGSLSGAMIWLNGHYLGRVSLDSAGFRYDLTPHLIFGGMNTLVLHMGHGAAPSVSLVKKDALHLGRSGTAISGVLGSGDRAEFTLGTVLQNNHPHARRGTLCCTLLDPNGIPLVEEWRAFHIFGQDRCLLTLKLTVDNAVWLTKKTDKYLIRTRLILNESLLEEKLTPFALTAVLYEDRSDKFSSHLCRG